MVRTLISNNSNLRTINFSKKRYFRNASIQHTFKVTVDGGADTCLDGQGHLFLEYMERKANVIGFDEELERKDLCIGTSITKLTLPDGSKILLMKNESIDHTTQPNSMLSVNQVRANGLDVDDCPTCYKVNKRQGSQRMIVGTDDNEDDVVVPFQYQNNLITYEVAIPTEDELTTLPMYVLTSNILWEPENAGRDLRYDRHSTTQPYLHGSQVNPDQQKAHQIITMRINATRVEGQVKPEILLKTMMIPNDLVAQKTIKATTQLGKFSERYPLRAHLKARYLQLNCRRQNETVATDTVFASITAIDGETCFQLYYGITSKLTIPDGMSTESEGSNSFRKYIKEYGAPLHIHNDNSKMQTSRAWTKLTNQYNIATSTTEPYHPNQNPAERRIQTVKARTRAILDATGAPSSVWIYAVHYVTDLLNFTADPSLN